MREMGEFTEGDYQSKTKMRSGIKKSHALRLQKSEPEGDPETMGC